MIPLSYITFLITLYKGYLLSVWLITVVYLDHLDSDGLCQLSTLESYSTHPPHPFEYCTLWEKVTMYSPRLRNRGSHNPLFWGQKIYIYYLDSSAQDICLFSPIYLLNPAICGVPCDSCWKRNMLHGIINRTEVNRSPFFLKESLFLVTSQLSSAIIFTLCWC